MGDLILLKKKSLVTILRTFDQISSLRNQQICPPHLYQTKRRKSSTPLKKWLTNALVELGKSNIYWNGKDTAMKTTHGSPKKILIARTLLRPMRKNEKKKETKKRKPKRENLVRLTARAKRKRAVMTISLEVSTSPVNSRHYTTVTVKEFDTPSPTKSVIAKTKTRKDFATSDEETIPLCSPANTAGKRLKQH